MKKITLLLGLIVMSFMFGQVALAAIDNSTVNKIEIKVEPKSKYVAGDKLDLSALVVTLWKSDITTPTDVTFANFVDNGIKTDKANGQVLKTTDTQVLISVNGKTAKQYITVSPAPKLEGISIKTKPTKLKYVVGEKLDLTGLVVEVRKSDKTVVDVAFVQQTETVTNPFSTYGITTSKMNGSSLTEKDSKIFVRLNKNINAYFEINVVLNLGCIEPKVLKRETDIMTAYEKLNASIKTSLAKRNTAIVTAWKIENNIERNKAVKTAWDTYKAEQKNAKTIKMNEVKVIWNTWKTDLKACKINSTLENQSSDL